MLTNHPLLEGVDPNMSVHTFQQQLSSKAGAPEPDLQELLAGFPPKVLQVGRKEINDTECPYFLTKKRVGLISWNSDLPVTCCQQPESLFLYVLHYVNPASFSVDVCDNACLGSSPLM